LKGEPPGCKTPIPGARHGARHTEGQIITVLKAMEAGVKTASFAGNPETW